MFEQYGPLYRQNPSEINNPSNSTYKRLYQSSIDDIFYLRNFDGTDELFSVAVTGDVKLIGVWDASGNLFPTVGSGPAGIVLKGNQWIISVAGILCGENVEAGDLIIALADSPAQICANWVIIENNIGYVPENVANKAIDFSIINNTLYPSVQAVATQLALKQNLLGFTPENVANKATDFSIINNTLYPSVQAVATQLALKQNLLGFTPENVANKATDFTTINNTLYPSVQAVATQLALKQNLLGFTPENVANKAINFTTVNDTLYPSVKSVNDKLTLDFVPYTGALLPVDLNTKSLIAGSIGVGLTPVDFLDITPSTTAKASLRLRAGILPTIPNDGTVTNDSTEKCFINNVAGINQYDSRVLFVQTANKAVGNVIVETSLFGAGIGNLTLPANFFSLGKTIRLKMKGLWVTAAASTVTLRLKLGGITVSTTIVASATPTIATATTVDIECDITARALGALGLMMGQGMMLYRDGASNANILDLTTAVPVVINTTISNLLDLTFQWGVLAAGQSITITNASVEVLK